MRRSDLLNQPDRPKPAPTRYAGQWVAWDRNRQRIIAHGRSLPEVHDAADAAGHSDASFERVPRVDEVFLGRI